MTRVIAPTDFSEASRVGLRAARAHAGRIGATVVMVHVWDRDALTFHSAALRSVEAENQMLIRSIEDQLQERLDAASAELFDGFEGVESRTLHDGSPARAIAEFAEPDDIIVLATHGRTGFKRVLIGSVAEKLVRLAPCPVLTIPARDSA